MPPPFPLEEIVWKPSRLSVDTLRMSRLISLHACSTLYIQSTDNSISNLFYIEVQGEKNTCKHKYKPKYITTGIYDWKMKNAFRKSSCINVPPTYTISGTKTPFLVDPSTAQSAWIAWKSSCYQHCWQLLHLVKSSYQSSPRRCIFYYCLSQSAFPVTLKNINSGPAPSCDQTKTAQDHRQGQ